MFRNLKLPVKQLIGFFLITLILIVVVLVGLKSIRNINTKMQTILETTPLVDAVKEIQLAVAQDLQVVMALTAALDTDELSDVWKVHQSYSDAVNGYAQAILSGAQINGSRIYPTRDQALKEIVEEATANYNKVFVPKLLQLHDLMVKKVNADNYDYDLADSLPELARQDGQRLSSKMKEVESMAKEVISRTEREAKNTSERAKTMLLWSAVAGVAIAVFLALFITRIITKPVWQAVEFAKKMAKGDLTQTLEIDQKDEIGVLAHALNDMVSSLAGMFGEVAQGVHTLSTSSEDLVEISRVMSDGANETSSRSNTLAAAAEEMSANISSVSRAAEQAATKVNAMAAASTQIDAMVSQVSEHSRKAHQISENAVSEMDIVTKAVTDLGNAAVEIDEVTDVIRDISEQVNLLALNATIEAARAGEAGKGFAVVAQEIKDLAHQTATATQQADEKLRWIQTRSTDLVSNMGGISTIIQDINGIVADVAGSVDQQKESTMASVSNTSETLEDIHVVSDNVNQSSGVSSEIARDISQVSDTSQAMALSCEKINQRAEALNSLASELDTVIYRFKL